MIQGSRKLALIVMAMMMAFASVAMPAGADETAAKPKRTIHGGDHYDIGSVERMLDESLGDADAYVHDKGIIKLKGKFPIDKNKPVEEAVLDFIDRHRNAFGLKDAKRELKQRGEKFNYGAGFQQIYNGVPVWQKGVGVSLDKDYDIREISANVVTTPDIDTTPLITADEAVEIVKSKEQDMRDAPVYQQELVINENKLVYQVVLGGWRYFVDAKSGKSYWKTEAWDFRPIP
ncbi:MAG: hypothetical protein HZC51_07500 [Nitrospirae bacterium]|nr:hypothetical protein [Nitrospirota bacterium]